MAHLSIMYLNIHKPRLLHSLLLNIILHNRKRHSQLLASFSKELAPLAQGRVVRYRVVVALDIGLGFEALNPAPRAAAFVCLLEEGRPVADATEEPAHVDVVYGVRLEGPLAGAVLDFASGWSGCSLKRTLS